MTAAWILAIIILLLVLGALCERRAELRFRARCAPPGELFAVAPGKPGRAPRRQHLLRMGERRPGVPVVILEAGHGAWSSCWQKVMPEIARHTRVCARDRAGYGWSDPDPRPLTASGMVDDLRALLDAAGEPGPYLLVGHSMGSSVARLFASRYPRDAAGMVWVDPVHEDLAGFLPVGRWFLPAVAALAWLGALLARAGVVRFSGLAAQIARYPSVTPAADADALLEQVAAPVYLETLARETLVLNRAAGWAGTRESFGGLPVTSLEARYPDLPAMPALVAPLVKLFLRLRWGRFHAGWAAMHDRLAARCQQITRVPVQGGHVIMDEHPQVVIDAILRRLDDRQQV